MANFDCDTENICGKLIWSEGLSVAVMCIGVNSFSIWSFDALLHSYRRIESDVRSMRIDCFGMKVKNGNEIIKFASTVDAEVLMLLPLWKR